jgi:RHS repeat-associated protein
VNHNVTSLVNTSGTEVEHYVYDPYGAVTVFDNSGPWVKQTGGSAFDNDVQFGGYKFDKLTGLNYSRERYYNSSTGIWQQRDQDYIDSLNLYQYALSTPTNGTDPSGRFVQYEVDKAKCTVKLILNISLRPDPSVENKLDGPQIVKRVKESIEKEWNNPNGAWTCAKCKVTFVANVEWVPYKYKQGRQGREVTNQAVGDNNIVINNLPPKKFRSETRIPPLKNWQRTFGEWSAQDSDWVYAHEAGHLMNVIDEYTDDPATGESVPMRVIKVK